jgi:hypothetical protein
LVHDKNDIDTALLQFVRQNKRLPFHPARRQVMNINCRGHLPVSLMAKNRRGRIRLANVVINDLHKNSKQ